MILACYVGFSRLHHRFLKREPMLTGTLRVAELPPQSTFWRFLASLHLGIARQLLTVEKRMRERVWAAANVGLDTLTIDTDTTVHTLFGNQMGARKGYNPKNKGKKSYQPILSFIAETREYAAGALRNGDRPDGREIAAHLDAVAESLPPTVKRIYARADSGFYCREAIAATMFAYALQRQRFPLMCSRISSRVGAVRLSTPGVCTLRSPWRHSSSRATAEQIWPGVQ
jgi:hypothetical protein